jgi:hypothetical protein
MRTLRVGLQATGKTRVPADDAIIPITASNVTILRA